MFGSYLPSLIELLLAMVVVLVTVVLTVRRLDETFAWIAVMLLRVLCLAFFIRWLAPLVGAAIDGVVPRLLVTIVAAGLGTILVLRLIPTSWRVSCQERSEAFVQRRPRWLRMSVKTLMLLVFWGVMLVAIDLTGTAIAGSGMARDCDNHTLVLRHWIGTAEAKPEKLTHLDVETPQEDVASKDRAVVISAAADRQADFFGRFTDGLEKSKSALYASVGIDDLKHEFQLVQKLHQLDLEDKLWLIENNEDLAVLAADPAFKRIVGNEQLLNRIDQFTAGSLDQIVHIGMDEDINLLLENHDFLERVRNIDLSDLLQQCQQRPKPPSQ